MADHHHDDNCRLWRFLPPDDIWKGDRRHPSSLGYLHRFVDGGRPDKHTQHGSELKAGTHCPQPAIGQKGSEVGGCTADNSLL